MSATRQRLIDLIDQLHPEQQEQALEMLQSMTQVSPSPASDEEVPKGDGAAGRASSDQGELSDGDLEFFDAFAGSVDVDLGDDEIDDVVYQI